MHATVITKLLIVSGLFLSAAQQLFSNQTWWFIQNVNLIFHEAGHIFMMFFGETLSILGGSLFEISIPLIVATHFYFTKQYLSAAFGAWWLSTAFLSVSIYAADAQERLLPLITRDVNTHDWFNLLAKYRLLQYDDMVGYGFWLAGLCAAISIIWFAYQDDSLNRTCKGLLRAHSRPQ